MGDIRPVVDKVLDRFTGLPNGRFLKMFPDYIEKHYSHPFRIFADIKSPNGSDAHQEELIENVSFSNVSGGLEQYLTAYGQIGSCIPDEFYKAGKPLDFHIREKDAR